MEVFVLFLLVFCPVSFLFSSFDLYGVQRTVELKKYIPCSVQLRNRSDHYVAFKVKTTSPTKYSVRPNVGIIKPRETCDFTVIMQAMKAAPPGLQCDDKFLVQSTVVAVGTTEGDITSDIFVKDSGRHVQQRKMKVFLVDHHSATPALLLNNARLEKDPHYELCTDFQSEELGSMPPPDMLERDVSTRDDTEVKDGIQSHESTESSSNDDDKGAQEQKLAADFEDLKSKLLEMDSMLKEADHTIGKLADERNMIDREKEMLKQEVGSMRKNRARRSSRTGFPFLFVCMVALISLAFGYHSRS